MSSSSRYIHLLLITIIFTIQNCNLFNENHALDLTLKIDEDAYYFGDSIIGRFLVENLTEETITFKFSSSRMYELILKDDHYVYYIFPELCQGVNTYLEIKPYSTKTFVLDHQIRWKPEFTKVPGYYQLVARLADGNSHEIKKLIQIKG